MNYREILMNLIINAKRTDPETGSWLEYLVDYLIANGVVVNKWIPVSERLPDEKTLVLCIGVRGGMFLGMTSGSFRSVYGGKPTVYFSVPNARIGREATHWMPLPEMPK